MKHRHIQILLEIHKELNTNKVPYIIVGSVARLLKDEKVEPYDIDIFTDIQSLKNAHKVLAMKYDVGDILDYKENGKTFKEFHFNVGDIPVEVCELNEIDYSKCTIINIEGNDIYCGN